MSDGMHGKCDPVLDTHLTHQFGNVRLYRALLDSEHNSNFLVRSSRDQKFQNLFFSVGESNASGWENTSWRRSYAVDEDRHHAPRRPNGVLIHHANGLDKFSR